MIKDVPVIREEECLGCSVCEEMCPAVFRFNASLGYALVINPTGASAEEIQEVMDSCPSSCIDWAGN